MKVCRKCKKHVTNKSKICKFCGADVSKCKIIKNNPAKVNKNLKNIPKNKDEVVKEKVNIAVELKEEKKLSTSKQIDKKTVDKKKNTIKSKVVISKNKKENKSEVNTRDKSKTNLQKNNSVKKTNKFLIFDKIKKSFVSLCTKIKSINISFKVIKNSKLKKVVLIIIILLILGALSYSGLKVYRHFTNYDNTVNSSLKATNNRVFAMGDVITYKNVNYEVINVKTSEGNSYKSPKEGNIFLIITVAIENNADSKIEYSYENWTMSNSKGSESKRIFSSINVDTALYSGDLVIGGIKKGSMVFEQPKDDNDLRLNFYELKENKDKEHYIDTNKKIFSVSIKVPEKKQDLKDKSKTVNTSNKE